ncbi:MAG: hypothetical protein HQL26_01235, partial [Candidatus Omnitrophica bacterium]|nr:hypothetical protein [Candidatus Omnitrophota bacterium]
MKKTNVFGFFSLVTAMLLVGSLTSYVHAQQTTNGFTIETYTKGTPITFAGMDQINEPLKNQCISDSHYGNVDLCKAGDQIKDIGTVGDMRAVYSRFPHENSDGTKYFMLRDETDYRHIIYNRADNSVYKIVSEFPNQESNELRWDYSGNYPNRLYYVSGCRFNQYDISTGVSQLVHDFSKDYDSCASILTDVEGDSSADSRYWVWMVMWPYDGTDFNVRSFIAYDKQTNTVVSQLTVDDYIKLGGKYDFYDANGNHAMPRPNMVEVAPSGKKVVLNFDMAWGGAVNANNWQYYG